MKQLFLIFKNTITNSTIQRTYSVSICIAAWSAKRSNLTFLQGYSPLLVILTITPFLFIRVVEDLCTVLRNLCCLVKDSLNMLNFSILFPSFKIRSLINSSSIQGLRMLIKKCLRLSWIRRKFILFLRRLLFIRLLLPVVFQAISLSRNSILSNR